jgi:hypothetical protein
MNAMLDVTGKIEEISPRHKRLLGEQIGMSLICSRRFSKDGVDPEGKPLLLNINLKKNRCGFLVYLPADAFWALPAMIASKAVTHIEATFDDVRYGSGNLLSLHFAPASKLTTLSRQPDP